MSGTEKQLQYKYDEYEEDFHQQEPYQNHQIDYNMQTMSKDAKKIPSINKDQNKYEVKINKNQEEDYQQDFVQKSQHNQQLNLTYELPVLDKNNPDREKMIEQNIKLKTQIYELAKQMDEIMQREKKAKKYGIRADEEEDETVRQKKIELKKQQLEIMQLKNKIFLTKRQLQHVYDSRGIQGKEDQLKNLQNQLKVLQNQKDALLRVKRQQNKALKMIRNDHEYEEKVKLLKQQLHLVKEDCKGLSQKLLENERILRKNHQLLITKQSKVKEMESKIQQSKQKAKKQQKNQQQIITNEMIEQVDHQIADIEKERRDAEREWNSKIKTIQIQLMNKKLEEQKKLLILKEKQKQLRLNQIRIKELKKLIQNHQSQMNQKNNIDHHSDMKEFRHKRNIKHLEK